MDKPEFGKKPPGVLKAKRVIHLFPGARTVKKMLLNASAAGKRVLPNADFGFTKTGTRRYNKTCDSKRRQVTATLSSEKESIR
jgi:hypothetical protein